MTVQRALDHFNWKFKNKWKPTKSDVDAYNELVLFVEQKHKQQVIDNQLFGKLYIYLFGEFVNHYKATAMDNIPQSELNKILDKDLRLIVDEVKDRLNFSEMENVIKETKKLDSYEPMSYEEVADNMRIMVNAALNTYQNNKHEIH